METDMVKLLLVTIHSKSMITPGLIYPKILQLNFGIAKPRLISPTTQNLVSKGTSPNSYNYWVFVDGQGNVKSGYTGFSTAYWHQTSNGNSPSYNYWHYIVFEKNSTMEWYYIDAKLWDSEAYTENALNISTPLVIGGSSPTTGPRVDFDLLKIFNYTRTQSDVHLPMNNTCHWPALIIL